MSNKKVIKTILDIIILAAVIALYVLAIRFIYDQFRERKRKEISDGILEKVNKKIDKSKQSDEQIETNVEYKGNSYTVLGTIGIPKVNFYQPILKENTYGAYNVSVVKIKGPNLNEPGNVVIGGHNYMRSKYFMVINRLVKNDKIMITDLRGRKVIYYVYDYYVTSDDDAEYLKDIDDGGRYVTLVTCNKGGVNRYIVRAKAR